MITQNREQLAGHIGCEGLNPAISHHHPFRMGAGQHQPGTGAQARNTLERPNHLGLFSTHDIGERAMHGDSRHDVQTDTGFNKWLESLDEILKACWTGFIGDLTPALGTSNHAAGDRWQVRSTLPPIIGHCAESLREIPVGCSHDSPRLCARLENFPVHPKQMRTQG